MSVLVDESTRLLVQGFTGREGTIRKLYASSIERNCIHGSDAPDTAAFELAYFFSSMDLT